MEWVFIAPFWDFYFRGKISFLFFSKIFKQLKCFVETESHREKWGPIWQPPPLSASHQMRHLNQTPEENIQSHYAGSPSPDPGLLTTNEM